MRVSILFLVCFTDTMLVSIVKCKFNDKNRESKVKAFTGGKMAMIVRARYHSEHKKGGTRYRYRPVECQERD